MLATEYNREAITGSFESFDHTLDVDWASLRRDSVFSFLTNYRLESLPKCTFGFKVCFWKQNAYMNRFACVN